MAAVIQHMYCGQVNLWISFNVLCFMLDKRDISVISDLIAQYNLFTFTFIIDLFFRGIQDILFFKGS